MCWQPTNPVSFQNRFERSDLHLARQIQYALEFIRSVRHGLGSHHHLGKCPPRIGPLMAVVNSRLPTICAWLYGKRWEPMEKLKRASFQRRQFEIAMPDDPPQVIEEQDIVQSF